MHNKPWIVVLFLLGAVVMFALGALQLDDASLKNTEFDLFLGLVLASIGLAIWAAPGS